MHPFLTVHAGQPGLAPIDQQDENMCKACGDKRLTFEPPSLYCTCCGQRIKRNQVHHFWQSGSVHLLLSPGHSSVSLIPVVTQLLSSKQAALACQSRDALPAYEHALGISTWACALPSVWAQSCCQEQLSADFQLLA